jgi:hypothetical protein
MPPKKAEDRHSGTYTRRASPLTGLQRLGENEGSVLMPSSNSHLDHASLGARWGLKSGTRIQGLKKQTAPARFGYGSDPT